MTGFAGLEGGRYLDKQLAAHVVSDTLMSSRG